MIVLVPTFEMKHLLHSFFKQIYRYTRSRSYRHSEKIWPFMQVKRNAEGYFERVSYWGKPIEFERLDAITLPPESDLLILASGPSIKNLNLNLLKQADWMAVNGAVSILSDYPNQSLKYYLVLDQGFVVDRIDIIASLISNKQLIFITNLYCLNYIFQLLGHDAFKARLILLEDRQLPVYLPKRSAIEMAEASKNPWQFLNWDVKKNVGFSLNLEQGYICGRTVVYLGLQLAAHWRYSRVFLAGVDMTRFNQPRFYEKPETQLPTKLEQEFAEGVYPSFQIASKTYHEQGIEAYNLCLDSGLDDSIFLRVKIIEPVISGKEVKIVK